MAKGGAACSSQGKQDPEKPQSPPAARKRETVNRKTYHGAVACFGPEGLGRGDLTTPGIIGPRSVGGRLDRPITT